MKNAGNEYPWQGMLIVTFLMLLGCGLIFFTGLFDARSYKAVIECLKSGGMLIIFSLFFIFVGVYCWVLFFKNVILKPKIKGLYLKEKNSSMYTFLDKKGKVFYYYDEFRNKEYLEGRYYDVLKTSDAIREIMQPSMESFEIPKEKISYWLNFYSPFGNFENIFLLPIVYVIFLPGLLSMIFAKGFDKIHGLVISAYPTYIIVYDLIKKIEKNNQM